MEEYDHFSMIVVDFVDIGC